MTFAEVAIKPGNELSERFVRKFLRLREFFYLRIGFLEKGHNEVKPLAQKTGQVADLFFYLCEALISFLLTFFQLIHLRIETGLLVEQEIHFSFPFFVTHPEDLFSP